jgi:ABC-2 type transport system ATP-binding protein
MSGTPRDVIATTGNRLGAELRTGDGPAIELSGVSKRFGRTLAVDNLSLTIARGSTFGLLGPNGAGKSTTIKMLMGMLSITAGEVRVLDLDVSRSATSVKQFVGYVPETHHVYRWMRVGEVIGFCRALFTAWNDQTCREMLERFGLDPRKKVKHLSKGMLVKLSLLLAVSHDPELLILDEPVAGLDPLAREEFLDGVLRTICQRGQTVLISSHTLDDVRRLADTVGILYEGRLLVQGRIDEMLAGTKRIRATLRDGRRPAGLPAGTIYDSLHGREWLVTVGQFGPQKLDEVRALEGVEHVEVIDLGLEDLFKDIVKGQRAAK